MTKVESFKLELGKTGVGYIKDLKLEGGSQVPTIVYEGMARFSVVVSILSSPYAYYDTDTQGKAVFILKK